MFRRPANLALSAIVLLAGLAIGTWQALAQGGSVVAFPDDYAAGQRYATVRRGNVREELFTSRAAIEAAKAGQPMPDGTVVTMEDYRDDRLYRYVVMEKRAGWGTAHPAETRTGDWRFAVFAPDRAPRRDEDEARCMACHRPRADTDFLFTYDRMRASP